MNKTELSMNYQAVADWIMVCPGWILGRWMVNYEVMAVELWKELFKKGDRWIMDANSKWIIRLDECWELKMLIYDQCELYAYVVNNLSRINNQEIILTIMIFILIIWNDTSLLCIIIYTLLHYIISLQINLKIILINKFYQLKVTNIFFLHLK